MDRFGLIDAMIDDRSVTEIVQDGAAPLRFVMDGRACHTITPFADQRELTERLIARFAQAGRALGPLEPSSEIVVGDATLLAFLPPLTAEPHFAMRRRA